MVGTPFLQIPPTIRDSQAVYVLTASCKDSDRLFSSPTTLQRSHHVCGIEPSTTIWIWFLPFQSKGWLSWSSTSHDPTASKPSAFWPAVAKIAINFFFFRHHDTAMVSSKCFEQKIPFGRLFFLICLSKVQNLTFFPFFLIRIRFFRPRNVISEKVIGRTARREPLHDLRSFFAGVSALAEPPKRLSLDSGTGKAMCRMMELNEALKSTKMATHESFDKLAASTAVVRRSRVKSHFPDQTVLKALDPNEERGANFEVEACREQISVIHLPVFGHVSVHVSNPERQRCISRTQTVCTGAHGGAVARDPRLTKGISGNTSLSKRARRLGVESPAAVSVRHTTEVLNDGSHFRWSRAHLPSLLPQARREREKG